MMSDAVWLAIIGVVTMVIKEMLDQWRAVRAARHVKEVKDDLAVVKHATNSLTDRLVASADMAGQQKGADDERAREDARRKES